MKISLKTLIKEMGEKPRYRAQLRPEPNVDRPSKINRSAGQGKKYMSGRIAQGISKSVWDLVDYLKKHPGASEGDMLRDIYGQTRDSGRFAARNNKPMADLLRRALDKGIIQRAKKTSGPGRTQYTYFLPGGSK